MCSVWFYLYCSLHQSVIEIKHLIFIINFHRMCIYNCFNQDQQSRELSQRHVTKRAKKLKVKV